MLSAPSPTTTRHSPLKCHFCFFNAFGLKFSHLLCASACLHTSEYVGPLKNRIRINNFSGGDVSCTSRYSSVFFHQMARISFIWFSHSTFDGFQVEGKNRIKYGTSARCTRVFASRFVRCRTLTPLLKRLASCVQTTYYLYRYPVQLVADRCP